VQRRRRRLEREAGVSLAPARGVFSFALARGATRRPSFSLLRAALLLLAPAPPPRAHVACAPLETDREAEGGERARVLFLSLSRFPTLPTSPSPPKVKERVLRGKQKYAGVVKEERRRARRSARVVPLLPSFFNRRAGVFLVSHAHTHNAARPSRVVLVAAVSPPCRRRVCLPRERGKEVGGALDKKSDKAGHWTKKSDKAGHWTKKSDKAGHWTKKATRRGTGQKKATRRGEESVSPSPLVFAPATTLVSRLRGSLSLVVRASGLGRRWCACCRRPCAVGPWNARAREREGPLAPAPLPSPSPSPACPPGGKEGDPPPPLPFFALPDPMGDPPPPQPQKRPRLAQSHPPLPRDL